MDTRLSITVSAAAMALALVGCRQPPREEPRPTEPTAPEITTTEPSTAATTLSTEDREFMTNAASGGMLEVTLGADATARGTAAEVKAFGRRMASDHGKANDELEALAAKKGVTLPTDMNAKHKELVTELSKLSGAKFDARYASEMVDDHEKDVEEFREASRNAKDPELRAWAAKTLPILEEHLTMAKEVKAKTKPTS